MQTIIYLGYFWIIWKGVLETVISKDLLVTLDK